jgi:hydroxymethylpyrimidine pyrophosphatase-like HAD family hydrolase
MNIPQNTKTIAVDFDGTIVEDRYPSIGKPLMFAFDTLKMLQKDGHRLILWTYRDGNELEDAVEFCKKNGIEFYAVNKNFSEEVFNEKTRRKLNVDIFIDDRNVGGFIGWGKIYQILTGQIVPEKKKKSLFGFKK